jgi:hypothetical protein
MGTTWMGSQMVPTYVEQCPNTYTFAFSAHSNTPNTIVLMSVGNLEIFMPLQ